MGIYDRDYMRRRPGDNDGDDGDRRSGGGIDLEDRLDSALGVFWARNKRFILIALAAIAILIVISLAL